MRYYLTFSIACLLCLLLAQSCSKTGRYVSFDMVKKEQANGRPLATCGQWEHYVPDTARLDLTPMRYIKVNFHIMQRGDGTGNFTKGEGEKYVENILRDANKTLRQGNKPMNLPKGNETPVLPQRYQYVLTPDPSKPGDTGVYYHKDDELYYMVNKGEHRKSIFDKRVVEKYSVQKGEVLNVFFMQHHKDSLDSPYFRKGDSGVAIGSAVKMVGLYYNYTTPAPGSDPPFYFAEWFEQGLLNHEIGHVLGLGHSWVTNDRCDDTPKHPNCWNFGKPPCDVASNNVMDYNTYRNAWTPCQLGIVHKNMSQKGSLQRKLLVKDWCELDETATTHVRGTELWPAARDLRGHLVVHRGAELTINCRVSIPRKGRVTVKPGGRLVLTEFAELDNDCGDLWDGILVEEASGKQGEVVMVGSPACLNAAHPITP